MRYPWHRPGEREDVCNDGAGTITFNYLQQSEPDDSGDCEIGLTTTDPWDITDGAVGS
jgi:hypothetical protein